MFIHVLTRMGKLAKVDEYREWCKKQENGDLEKFSYYIHGWFLIWLDE